MQSTIADSISITNLVEFRGGEAQAGLWTAIL